MKTHHTNEEIQAAIDAACKATASGALRPSFALLRLIESDTTDDWSKETPARLHLLKSALDKLPEPTPPVVDGKTPGQLLHEKFGNTTTEYPTLAEWCKTELEEAASAVLAAFGGAGLETAIARAEEAEAELADEKRKRLYAEEHLGILAKTFGYEGKTWCNMVSYLCPRLHKAERDAARPQLSILRPIAEAGEVPAGAVRVFASKLDEWKPKTYQITADTHFADIRLPKAKAPAVEDAKPVYVGYTTDEMPTIADPYAELKAAHTAGKVIQWHNGHMWHDLSYSENPLWIHPAKDYRIKPAEPVKPWTPAVGDVVTLKSGGLKMTLCSIRNDSVGCEWHDDSGVPHARHYYTAALQPA